MSSSNESQPTTDLGLGKGSWSYRKLSGAALNDELSRLATPKSLHRTDCVTIQPCFNPEERSQDRYIILDLDLPGGLWTFAAVFDGHGGHEAVDYAVESLAPAVERILKAALIAAEGNNLPYATISKILVQAISEIDDAITCGIKELFPGGPEEIAKMSDNEIDAIVNDFETGGLNNAKVLKGMRGSTVLISLVDPAQQNLWVASLGDCQAVLGTKDSTKMWKTSLLSFNHNGVDPSEAQRIKSEHPGEEECILQDRVLGSIAVTRAIGDHFFRLPAIYVERVLKRTKPGFRMSKKLEEILPRNISPPYLSNIAEVKHVQLDPSEKDGRFLILCSDGLLDLYMYDPIGRILKTLEQIVEIIACVVSEYKDSDGSGGNAAAHLLRHALGGDDEDKVSQLLTVEMDERWIDDVTILVQNI